MLFVWWMNPLLLFWDTLYWNAVFSWQFVHFWFDTKFLTSHSGGTEKDTQLHNRMFYFVLIIFETSKSFNVINTDVLTLCDTVCWMFSLWQRNNRFRIQPRLWCHCVPWAPRSSLPRRAPLASEGMQNSHDTCPPRAHCAPKWQDGVLLFPLHHSLVIRTMCRRGGGIKVNVL